MYAKLRKLQGKYHKQVIIGLVVVASAALVLSQVSGGINQLVSGASALSFVTLLLVADVALSLEGAASRAKGMRVSREQDYLMPTLLDAVETIRPGGTADLLEYAGISITPLIRRLKEHGATMRILLKHPETCGRYQILRTQTNIEALYSSVLSDYSGKFEIRCYRAPYTLRGRRIGSRFLEVGWLTPDFARDTAFGRVNPSVYLDPAVEGGEYLLSLFQKTFQDLWEHPTTVDASSLILDDPTP